MYSFQTDDEYKKLRGEFMDYIFSQVKYQESFSNLESKIGMISYIGFYFSYPEYIRFFNRLKRIGEFEEFKKKNKLDYESQLQKIAELDDILFIKTFQKGYDTLSDEKHKIIFSHIKLFLNNELTEDFFIRFTQSLGSRYEYFFYQFYDKVLAYKVSLDSDWENKRIEDRFLYYKRGEYSKACHELPIMR